MMIMRDEDHDCDHKAGEHDYHSDNHDNCDDDHESGMDHQVVSCGDHEHDDNDNHVHETNYHHGDQADNDNHHEDIFRLCRQSQNQAMGEVPLLVLPPSAMSRS